MDDASKHGSIEQEVREAIAEVSSLSGTSEVDRQGAVIGHDSCCGGNIPIRTVSPDQSCRGPKRLTHHPDRDWVIRGVADRAGSARTFTALNLSPSQLRIMTFAARTIRSCAAAGMDRHRSSGNYRATLIEDRAIIRSSIRRCGLMASQARRLRDRLFLLSYLRASRRQNQKRSKCRRTLKVGETSATSPR